VTAISPELAASALAVLIDFAIAFAGSISVSSVVADVTSEFIVDAISSR